jgi:two-component system, chemotaxis family, CheB/CheR fusion protein
MGTEESGQAGPIIIAVGASAVGIQALQAFFRQISDQTGAAFIVVVHLDPQHDSELPRILTGCTRMPVVQVETNEKIQADHVYVMPPNRRLQLVDHEISAVQFDEPRGHRTPIDLFFRSIAEGLGHGFAVILNGAGSDGAIGARVIKESGGMILVQESNEGEYPSTPRSAIAIGVADIVLPVRDLADRLAELIRIKRSTAMVEDGSMNEDQMRRILAHLRVRTGHDFSKYKRSTVMRRIARRMQVTRTADLREYCDTLRDTREEAEALLGDLLISVTSFFRDHGVFEAIKSEVIPLLFEGGDPNEAIRVWVPGCATGEEAYSVAMLLLEEGPRSQPPLQVFGSDLDSRAIAFAREGRYPASIEEDVNESRLRRFFNPEGDGYRVRQELRDVVLFSVHDLLKGPPFSHVNLISCRNVLIYLDRELQEQVCGTFHYALKPGGFLLLGASETADNPPGLFRSLDRNARIYQSTARPGDRPRLLPRLLGQVGVSDFSGHASRAVSPNTALSEAALHRRLIEKVAPPSVLVDEAHRLVHLSETVGRYILPSGGPLSGDVVDMVRPELRFELRSALHRVFEQNESSLSLPILVSFNGSRNRVHLFVKHGERADMAEPQHALVMFIEGEVVPERPLHPDRQGNDEIVRRLTQELELTQARLRTVREDSESTNEELRAANEELQSVNEEYRSTSEELETSKEELQSINEELQTVNSELKLKLETISRAHSDLQNLMAATDIGTLFLDSGLRIKRFTDRVTDLFSITAGDEERLITDFAHQLEYDGLIRDACRVIADAAPSRREIRSRSNRWYDVRLRPYRTVDDQIDGVVITFVDISHHREVEDALRKSERQLREQSQLVELSRAPIFVWEFDGNVVAWNRGSQELYGYSSAEAIGTRKDQLLGTSVAGSSFEELKARLQSEGSWTGDLMHKTKDGRTLIVESRLQLETFDGQQLVLESVRDDTERKASERRQHMLLRELGHRVRNTLAVVQAVAHQTFRGVPGYEAALRRFEGRLSALASAHNLLTDSNWCGADFMSLARQQLEPYMSDGPDRISISGEAVSLQPDIATPFGLVLHELATNAARHGSLSVPAGTVSLTWAVGSKGSKRILTVTWREGHGPPVQRPKSGGLGSALIEGAIPGATVKRDFASDGLICTIEVSLKRPGDSRAA